MPGIVRPALPEYGSEVGGNLKFAGVDQGIDFTGSGPVYALGNGKITAIHPMGTARFNDGLPGGGSELVYQLGNLDKYVYVAEDFLIKSGLKVGDTITKGQVLGNVNSTWPGIETGYSTSQGSPLQPLLPRGSVYPASGYGAQFQADVKATSPGGGSGSLTSPGAIFGNPFGKGGIVSSDSKVPGVGAVVGVVDSVPKFLGKLTDPNLWIRVLEIVGGSVLFLAGLYLLVKDVGLGVNVPKLAPVAKVAAAV